MNHVGMNLFHHRQAEILSPDGGLQALSVLEDVFLGVPFHKAQVEELMSIEGARSAKPRAETMCEPGELGKRDEFKHLQAPGFAQPPRRGNGVARSAGSRPMSPALLPG